MDSINMDTHTTSKRNGHVREEKETEDGEEEEEEEEEGEFVRAYVLKRPKTPIEWIKRWAIQSSCNGIPNIQRSKSPLRLLVWVIIVIAGTVMTVISVVDTITMFRSYPINVAVTVDLVSTLQFPAITVCNINPVRKSKLHLGGKKFEDMLLRPYENSTDPKGNMVDRMLRGHVNEGFYNAFAPFNRSLQEEMGHQIDDMLLGCEYGKTPCTGRNFTILHNAYYGNCFTINTGLDGERTLQTHKPGSHAGMTLEFYLEQEEYVPSLTSSLGMRISIHDPEAMPFPEDTGLLIPPGYTTLIGLTMVNSTRLPSPFPSGCWDIEREDAKFVSVFSEHYRVDYTQEACQKTCYQRRVIEQCKCGDPREPLNGLALGNNKTGQAPTTPCFGEEQEHCEERVKDLANANGLMCNCSVACRNLHFKTTISQSRWPNEQIRDSYADAIIRKHPRAGNTTADIDPRVSLARVQLFYEEMVMERVDEQKAYTLTNLYSDLGGNVGFYLGLSIVSVFELVELLIDLLVSSFATPIHRRKAKRRAKARAQEEGYGGEGKGKGEGKGEGKGDGQGQGQGKEEGKGKGHAKGHSNGHGQGKGNGKGDGEGRGRKRERAAKQNGKRNTSKGKRDKSNGKRDKSSGKRDSSNGKRDSSQGKRDSSNGNRDSHTKDTRKRNHSGGERGRRDPSRRESGNIV